jgi:hypothetical protein
MNLFMERMAERVLLAIGVIAAALLCHSVASGTDEPFGLCVNNQCAAFKFFDRCPGGAVFKYPDCWWCKTGGRCIAVNKACDISAGAPEQFVDVTDVQDVCDCNLAPPGPPPPTVQASGNYSGEYRLDVGRQQKTCQ